MAPDKLYFEDFAVGAVFESPRPRAVSAKMIARFGELSGDMNRLHFDETYAAATSFQGRIAHGLLGLSIASGLLHDLEVLRETIMAFRQLEWKFKAPVRIGDSLSLVMEVAQTRPAPGPGGLVRFSAALKNQRGETVQEGVWSLLVRKKP
ncbi:MAG: MaoC family dehydratase N-terminal domain-containing protein [Elusimicrobia bacterium]|nr:MaoC family dehydratase N-terminal domain-containing protein [Elusimicrobiota bacterium]